MYRRLCLVIQERPSVWKLSDFFVLPERPASDLRYEFIRLKCNEWELGMVFLTVRFIEFIKSCDMIQNNILSFIIHFDKILQKLSEIYFNTPKVYFAVSKSNP